MWDVNANYPQIVTWLPLHTVCNLHTRQFNCETCETLKAIFRLFDNFLLHKKIVYPVKIDKKTTLCICLVHIKWYLHSSLEFTILPAAKNHTTIKITSEFKNVSVMAAAALARDAYAMAAGRGNGYPIAPATAAAIAPSPISYRMAEHWTTGIAASLKYSNRWITLIQYIIYLQHKNNTPVQSAAWFHCQLVT